jgi:hypothetical protein
MNFNVKTGEEPIYKMMNCTGFYRDIHRDVGGGESVNNKPVVTFLVNGG